MQNELNYWTALSLEYANQRAYLDDLFRVYPTIPEGMREIEPQKWADVEEAFVARDNERLLTRILSFDLSPIKESYIAYLKRDASAASRNPQTVARLCGRLYELGLDEIYKLCSQPKETNRQIGPMFRRWIEKGALGVRPVPLEVFTASNDDAILDASDAAMKEFAFQNLGYQRNKGLDFLGRFNGKYVVGEAKFLTDFGGHQAAQLNDALDTLRADCEAVSIAILDGVIYIPGRNKMHLALYENRERNILSALVLREFLYSL